MLEDLPRRVRISDSHQTGFIAGGVLLVTVGTLTLAAPAGVSNWAWYVVGAVALGAALRARVWDSAPCKAWLLGHPFLLAAALLVAFAADGRYTAAWWALAALARVDGRVGDRRALPAGRVAGHVLAADAPPGRLPGLRPSTRR